MRNYFNVPSSHPLTRSAAIREAKGRNLNTTEQAGITWQGKHGKQEYLDWEEMTGAERQALRLCD